ncbi:Hypothetical predicted protein [Cloeon dipterum]|uniref:Gustatory receptor n=1 Tax=Cloeon dipterum TaxID=197152 RepID=A0A8S1CPV3_9INSE|nr:Hypothetical predicted protein [Cloeon dipterum]
MIFYSLTSRDVINLKFYVGILTLGIFSALELFITVWGPQKVKEQSTITTSAVCTVFCSSLYRDTRALKEAESFLNVVSQRSSFSFSAWRLFDLDMQLLFTTSAAIANYMVVLIQLK